MTLQAFFTPRGVAVIGSTAQGKIGYELIRQLREGGFDCAYAVNPKAQGAFGARGFTTVSAIDAPVDLAVIASPASTVIDVLEDCARAGVRAVVIITAGFAEIGNRAGEEAIKRTARQHGLRVIGPNCAGILNTRHRLFASLETRPPAGDVAFISQSGALGGAVLSWAEEQGVGFSKFVSYGNRVDVDEIDLLPYLAEDPETKVGALYIESVVDGRAFMRAVQTFTRVKPLIVIKSGRSAAGQRATLSHTGSLAGADAVYDAALRECGAIRVDGVEEMFDLCKGFVSLPPVKGRRVVIVTNSGGPGVLAADRAEALGLQLPEPEGAVREALKQRLPPNCALKNPIDLTVEGTEAGYRETLTTLLADYDAARNYDAALAIDVSTPYLDSVALARGVAAAAQATGKPVAANFMAGRIVADGIAYLSAHGVPNFVTGERALTVLARMAEWGEAQTRLQAAGSEKPAIEIETRSLPTGPLLEPTAMAWLKENGVSVPEFRFVTAETEVAAACRSIGYPVVMKVVSPDIIHKSDVGGVQLNIRDDDAARAAFAALQQAARGKDFRGVIIYPQLSGGQEVLIGLSRDPQFGPVVALGLGGIYAEVWRDVALRLAPIDHAGALAMMREIRSYPLLAGARGRPAADLDALAELLVAVSRLPLIYPEIAEVDLNPVMVFARGAVAVDVRIIRKEPA